MGGRHRRPAVIMDENLASTTLSGAINTAQTTIPLTSGNSFPVSGMYYITVTPVNTFPSMDNSEIMLVKSRTTNSLTVERAARRTIARSFPAGSLVYVSVYSERTLRVGDIIMTMNTEPAYGRLFLDGGQYQEEDYPLLAAHIKKNPALGRLGSGFIYLTDARQRFPLAKAAAGTGSTIGATGGEIDHKHGMSTYTGAGVGFGTGDVRAAIGATHDDAKRIGYAGVDAIMPAGGTRPNYKYSINSRDSQANEGNQWNHFTPVFGYTNSNNPPFIVVNFEVVAR